MKTVRVYFVYACTTHTIAQTYCRTHLRFLHRCIERVTMPDDVLACEYKAIRNDTRNVVDGTQWALNVWPTRVSATVPNSALIASTSSPSRSAS